MSLGDERDYGGDAGRPDGMGGTGQTRTRLPEGGDVYGGGRRPPRASRSLVTVVGVVVLLIAAIAFANRGGGTSSDTGDAKKPGAASTAASGVKPVTGRSGWIASGFAHDAQGAQSAAANFAVALGSDGMFKKTSRDAIISATHDPAVVDGLLPELDSAYAPGFLKNVGLAANGDAPSGQTFVSRTVPVGAQVTQQQSATTSVAVWCTGLVGLAGEGSTKPVTETWFTLTENLKWVGGDWKIESSSQKEGPTPVSADNRASTADEIAGAVQGFGGFTYAR
ncbi:hypothetical protein AB0M87_30335 [Streptomyces sp. NPDC051320]|uniref:hypothetical protein n=1 Tax=Streptomyces sp. NPDC051320 TaxID=3154644 RepID=UPI003448B8D4